MILQNDLLKLSRTTINELLATFSQDKELCEQFLKISCNDTSRTVSNVLRQIVPSRKKRQFALCILLGLKRRYEKDHAEQQ